MVGSITLPIQFSVAGAPGLGGATLPLTPLTGAQLAAAVLLAPDGGAVATAAATAAPLVPVAPLAAPGAPPGANGTSPAPSLP